MLSPNHLASQATLSRCLHLLDDDNNGQLRQLLRAIAKPVFTKRHQSQLILDIDSTHCDAYGHQEGIAYNGHYQAVGYHPQLLIERNSGLVLHSLNRPGKDADGFVADTFAWFDQSTTEVILCGDAGFPSPNPYALCDQHAVQVCHSMEEVQAFKL
ncbi:transposase [Lacticaseibacillus paracasei]|uniref:transposase n=1 Tax=Lacticaseibacillus paracasei TaxID=1597 RepID=UPI004045D668